jgi:hypothetical protein
MLAQPPAESAVMIARTMVFKTGYLNLLRKRYTHGIAAGVAEWQQAACLSVYSANNCRPQMPIF